MKITESQIKKIIEEESEEVLQELAPAIAALGGAAARGAAALGGAAARTAAKVAPKVGQAAKKLMSKQADVNKVLQGLNRIKAPTLMQKIDKPLEVQDLLMNILGNVQVDPKVLDTVLSRVKSQMKTSAKTPPPAAGTEPVGQPPAE
jgi:uncharacterized protein YpuA (DUF1002 family)